MADTKAKNQASATPKKAIKARIEKSKLTGRWTYSMVDLLNDPAVEDHFDRAAGWVEDAKKQKSA